MHELSRQEARRIAIRAQRLDAERPDGLLALVRQVSLLQLEPTAAVAPSAELVVWSRLGSSFDRADLGRATEARQLIELRGTVRPAEDLALYRGAMREWPGSGALRPWQEQNREWVAANDACRRDVLRRLTEEGPLPTAELPDTCVVRWRSSGWNNDRNVRMLLQMMVGRGEVAVAGREGRDTWWDLADRVYPDDPVVPEAEAAGLRDARRLAALGIARSRGPECGVEPLDVGEAGEAAVVDGVRGTWRVDPTFLGGSFRGRAALLSPFDRLLHDRKRMADLFEFQYVLEMFKPYEKRRWGYYALPVLYGDRLVGKLDVTSDRAAGVLRLNALHWDVDPSSAMTRAVEAEIADLARWLGLALRPAG